MTSLFRVLMACALAICLAACGSDADSTNDDADTIEPPGPIDVGPDTDEPADAETGDDEEPDAGATAGETTMPAGAVPASVEFPFPVPEGWAELEAFTESELGNDPSLIAGYEFPGDAASAAAHYLDLLTTAGFTAAPYPLGEAVNDASLTVEGTVDGALYKGMLDFNTHADGKQRVVINLVEQ